MTQKHNNMENYVTEENISGTYKVRMVNGFIGFVPRDFRIVCPGNPKLSFTLNEARQRFDENTAAAMDCWNELSIEQKERCKLFFDVYLRALLNDHADDAAHARGQYHYGINLAPHVAARIIFELLRGSNLSGVGHPLAVTCKELDIAAMSEPNGTFRNVERYLRGTK